jgi:hypothetical protein
VCRSPVDTVNANAPDGSILIGAQLSSKARRLCFAYGKPIVCYRHFDTFTAVNDAHCALHACLLPSARGASGGAP